MSTPVCTSVTMFEKWSEANTNIGHSLAKVLGIKLAYRDPLGATGAGETVTRGESAFSMGTVDTYSYNEPEPTSIDWVREVTPSGAQIARYFLHLFPFLTWITNYNLQWLFGDLVAGITVGAVVVPQGMAYAELAGLPVQFGLYSSFMGVLIYWFFATSKDITIGVGDTAPGRNQNKTLLTSSHSPWPSCQLLPERSWPRSR